MVEKVTPNTTNRAPAPRGCSYCRCFKPFDQVRVVRTRFGVPRAICDACQQARSSVKPSLK